ncbi:MAG: hypothetical protein GF341_11045 [candidate division Zixibacteria bacterium]|nr:hypothetical protein [candidate division Zixibacteria bacterium]
MDDSTKITARRQQNVVIAAIVTVMLLAMSSASQAQIVSGQPSVARQGFTYLSWTLEGDSTDVTVTQWHIPIVVNAALQENWELSVSSSIAASDADWDIDDDEISGLTDSRIQVAHSLAEDRILLSGGLSLPTGQTELDEASRSLLPWLTADFFTFPVKYHGEGLNLYGGAAGAYPAGDWVLGVATGIHLMGEYTPYEDGPEYTPGSRFILSGSAEREWVDRGKVSADLNVVFSGDDEADGEPVFSDGTMLDALLAGQRTFETAALRGGIRIILRGKNEILDAQRAELVSEENNTNGSEVRFFVSGQRELTDRLSGFLTVETHLLGANDYETDSRFYEGSANILGVGGGIDVRLSPMATGGIGIRIWNGSSDGSAAFESLDLKGFEITQRLTLTI